MPSRIAHWGRILITPILWILRSAGGHWRRPWSPISPMANERQEGLNTQLKTHNASKYCHGWGWFALIPVQAVEGTSHIVIRNMAINQHTAELPWKENLFFINRFYRDPKRRKLCLFSCNIWYLWPGSNPCGPTSSTPSVAEKVRECTALKNISSANIKLPLAKGVMIEICHPKQVMIDCAHLPSNRWRTSWTNYYPSRCSISPSPQTSEPLSHL